jgi:hypothetical protein
MPYVVPREEWLLPFHGYWKRYSVENWDIAAGTLRVSMFADADNRTAMKAKIAH